MSREAVEFDVIACCGWSKYKRAPGMAEEFTERKSIV